MNRQIQTIAMYLATTWLIGACATAQTAISAPEVRLTNVQLGSIDFSGQTFVLGFEVSNPNPFRLPVNHVSYGVKLDDLRFASGETAASFTVPANGLATFSISVDLDLIRTAPALLHVLRDGVTGDLAYELSGKLGVDVPFVDRVSFEKSGAIRLRPGEVQGRNHEP